VRTLKKKKFIEQRLGPFLLRVSDFYVCVCVCVCVRVRYLELEEHDEDMGAERKYNSETESL